jgi:hypothetical protein
MSRASRRVDPAARPPKAAKRQSQDQGPESPSEDRSPRARGQRSQKQPEKRSGSGSKKTTKSKSTAGRK